MRPSFQIFASDIDERAMKHRACRTLPQRRHWPICPPAAAVAGFHRRAHHFCPVKEIREMCIFSMHSVIKDLPILRLDLISCRNR